MPFDGVEHGSCPIIYPAYGSPGYDMTAAHLSPALQTAYAAARYSHRLIGTQTYRQWIGIDESYYILHGLGVRRVDEIAGRVRGYVPPHATHVFFDAWISPISGTPSIARGSIIVDDGADSEQSAVTSIELPPLDVAIVQSDVMDPIRLDVPTALISGQIALDGSVDPGGEISVLFVLDSVSVDGTETALDFRTIECTAWWESIG